MPCGENIDESSNRSRKGHMLVTRNSNCVDDSRAKQQGDQHGDSRQVTARPENADQIGCLPSMLW
jgi:hypothetical protein